MSPIYPIIGTGSLFIVEELALTETEKVAWRLLGHDYRIHKPLTTTGGIFFSETKRGKHASFSVISHPDYFTLGKRVGLLYYTPVDINKHQEERRLVGEVVSTRLNYQRNAVTVNKVRIKYE